MTPTAYPPELMQAAEDAFEQPHVLPAPGGRSLRKITMNVDASERFLGLLDKEISRRPTDTDLLMAKASALCRMMQMKSAEAVIDEVLQLDPDHLDARQRKKYWDDWKLLFDFPSWSEASTSVEPLFKTNLGKLEPTRLMVYIARVGLRLGTVVVQSVDGLRFDRGIGEDMERLFLVKVVKTDYGFSAPYYVLLKDDPKKYFRNEGFLSLGGHSPNTVDSAYWILRRLAAFPDCHIVFATGERVILNRHFTFHNEHAQDLRDAVERFLKAPPAMRMSDVERSNQWYMEHSELDAVRFPEKPERPTNKTPRLREGGKLGVWVLRRGPRGGKA
jgi:hypothetical protein